VPSPLPSVAVPGSAARFAWLSDEGPPPEGRVETADDRTTAQEAVQRLRGRWLVYRGNYKNARQLLAAVGRRLARRRDNARTPLELFRAERQSRQQEHETLTRLLVDLDGAYQLALRAAPDVADACRWRWGPAAGPALVPLRELLGLLGAFEWYRKGLAVAGLHGSLHPHYGVFTPTRGVYPELLRAIPDPSGQRVFDIGTGTGVLAFLLLERGAARAVATDVDPAAVASAREDALRLGFGDRFEARELDLFPEGRADLVVCNPPWLPEAVRGRLDAAVFDPGSRFLTRFLAELPAHLEPGGLGCLLISNLAVLLGLRPPQLLAEEIGRAGLRIDWKNELPASHPRSQDASDPLHALRSREVVTLYGLRPGQ
jgi:SAM-dependent methyltransferase